MRRGNEEELCHYVHVHVILFQAKPWFMMILWPLNSEDRYVTMCKHLICIYVVPNGLKGVVTHSYSICVGSFLSLSGISGRRIVIYDGSLCFYNV